MLVNDIKDFAGFVLGPILGILEGLFNIGAGIANFSLSRIGLGLFQIGAVGMPRLGADGGLAHPTTLSVFQPLISWLRSGSSLSRASQNHDIRMGDPNFGFLSSRAHFNWIRDAWANPGVQPGLFGQSYRALGTIGFGVAGSVLATVGN
jgi:hypothetical protein